jgi:hypothetical protein
MKNDYEIRGETTAIFLNNGLETIISTEKLPLVQELPGTWYAWWNDHVKNYYCRMDFRKNGKKQTIYLHRLVSNCPEGMHVDHFDNNTLNNEDKNLRVVANSVNQQNRKSAQANSKSGIRGVSWHRQTRKWQVTVSVNKKQYYFGLYDDISEAEIVAKMARAKLMPFSKDAIVK